MNTQWQTPTERATLLKSLVAHESITHSKGEQTFPYFIKETLMSLKYFQHHPDHIRLVSTDDERHAVMAFYQAPTSKETITLISHFDTVGIEDFGAYQSEAFDMTQLTAKFKQDIAHFDQETQADIQSGEYLFGRGSMDMKAGLMLHLSLIEKAILEQWDVNLILITVPDEEVTSKGMHVAVAELARLCQQYQLKIKLHLNSEPTFQQEGDDIHYFYTGSIGKIMPGALVYGRETHVGTPALGLSSNFVMSYILQEVEYHCRFKETFENETTPMPVTLRLNDIKQHYDVQTPFRTVALFNLFLYEKNANEVFQQFNEAVREGIDQAFQVYQKRVQHEGITHTLHIQMMTYQQLYAHACQQLGEATVQAIIHASIQQAQEPHEQAIFVIDELMQHCNALGPTVVTFFAPPYYPATNASYHPRIESMNARLQSVAMTQFNRVSTRIHYFNGISDLSYVSPSPNGSGFDAFRDNTPVFGRTYHIPFDAIEQIQAPFLNCGPIGKDAHKITERIHQKSAFEELPVLLVDLIQHHFLSPNV
ncbi:M20/M25/M40 family metallo-hydrolase [Staphylococcus lutrae]|uniref:Arginine utilization protein RocB n=1 Tax=Staphylococcus lutrae TaxID=155085 RepID=A0AAC9WM92_9STAP|nr:M20/M25/M40 family metallo-hydrolase [Staphylococcus lutrae]ARJ50537.1 arginine utilization protein RocB [Staphylococcus lutrae]PNZ37439.1 arginine utilization protein RocB [Staphylococcus lutrae]